MAWSGSPMAQRFASGGASSFTSRYWVSSMSWYSSIEIHGQRLPGLALGRADLVHQQLDALRLGGHAPAPGQPQLRPVFREDGEAQRVEGHDRRQGALAGQERDEPILHLGRGP